MACEGTQVENLPAEIRRKKVECRFGNKDYTNGTVRYIGRAIEYRQKVMGDAYKKADRTASRQAHPGRRMWYRQRRHRFWA